MNLLEKNSAELIYRDDKITYSASVYQDSESGLYVLFFRVEGNTAGDEGLFMFRKTSIALDAGTEQLDEYYGTAGAATIQYYPRLPDRADLIGRGNAVKLKLQSYDEAVSGMDTLEQDLYEYLRSAVGFRDESVVTTYTFSE